MIDLYESMMKRYKQFEPVLISDFEVSEWQHPVHNHNHYELIYIKHGWGRHFINSEPVNYQQGNVFLLGPEEQHYFEVMEKTQFIYLKFTDVYIHQRNDAGNSAVRHLEYLIKSRETHQAGFALSEGDQASVDLLFDLIVSLKHELMKNEHLIWMQVLVLSEILQRNMSEVKVSVHRSRDMQAIFCYIHKHIYHPEKLKADIMGEHFHLTSSYIGPYFKRNAGFTLREYIAEYRNGLIKRRMEGGRFTLKQIAAEFGLADESHVSKLLKT